MKSPEDTRKDASGILPLSYGQRSIWMAQEYLGEENPGFTISGLYRIRGPVDQAALKRALQVLLDRNRTLRSFLRSATPYPYLEPQEALEPLFTFHDVSRSPDPAAAAKEMLDHAAAKPFCLYNSPLCRFMLVKQSDSKCFLLTSYHHLVSDGWGAILCFNEIAATYNRLVGSADLELPEPVDYGEFLQAERDYEDSDRFKTDRDFWQEHYKDADPSPLFSPLPGCEAGYGQTRRLHRHFPPGLYERLIGPAREAGATPTSTLLAATVLFFSRFTDRERMLLASPYLNRKSNRFRRGIGHFVNNLPLNLSVNPEESFSGMAVETAKLLRKLMRHAAHPVDEMVSELDLRSRGSGTVYQVSFNHLAMTNAGHLGEAEVETTSHTNGHEHHIIGMSFWDINESGDVLLTMDYCFNYFTQEAAETLLNRFVAFLERLAESPDLACGFYDTLLPEEAARLADWSCGARAARPENRRIHEVFEATAAAHATLPAVLEGDSVTTYEELNLAANRVANALLAGGLRREEPVGVVACRSGALAATVLGIWKAGGCYLPLDPDYPPERSRFIIEDAGIGTIISLCEPSAALPARLLSFADTQLHSAAAVGLPGSANDLAYIIYTSGSTGVPKGVAIEHGGFLNMIAGQIEFLAMQPEDRVLLFASPCFDASLSELFMALLAGAALCPANRDLIDAPWDLRETMARLGVSVATFPPSYLRVFEGRDLPSLRALITAGEPPNPEDARHYAARLCYINAYGPTENSVCSTMGRVSPEGDGAITIGKPIPNVRTYILDRNLRPVPPGVVGELCLAGPGLAREYVNRPDLSATAFVRAPFVPHERLYRSGDLARWSHDGEIEFLGRKDDQIKVRGHRVEPGEIETVLASHPAVLQAAVVATSSGGACRLSGFIVPTPGAAPVPPEAIREWVSDRLPAYMHPSRITTLASLPISTAGKIDRRMLADVAANGAQETESVAPRSGTESALAAIWQECLQEGAIGAQDDFFARGGNSLLAIRMTQRINETFGISIPVRSIFNTPILRDLAARVEAALKAPGTGNEQQAAEDGCNDGRTRELSEAQRQLWVIQQMVDRPEVYNMPAVFDVEAASALQPELWEEALNAVIRRHESLRTIFLETGGSPMREVLAAVPFHMEWTECASRMESVALAIDRVHEPFDPAQPPLIRAGLAGYAPRRAIFYLCIHHLVGDGESMLNIMNELAYNLEGDADTTPVWPYSHAVAEERRYLTSPEAAADRQWWLKCLTPPPPALNLAPAAARPVVKHFAGARSSMRIPAATVAQLEELARDNHASLFSLLLALVKTLIHRRTGERDIVVGIPSTTRTRAEHTGSVGYYVNTLAIRDRVESDWSFAELLGRVQTSVAAAVAHGAYPFARLYGDLGLERDPSRSPVFDVMLAPQPGVRKMVRGGLVYKSVDFEVRAARFDLTFTYAQEPDGGLTVFADYDSGLFTRPAVEAMLAEFSALTEEVRNDNRTALRGTVNAEPAEGVCAAAERESRSDAAQVCTAADETTELLAEVWQSVLGCAAGPADNFFSLGGDSIKAIQVCGRLRSNGLQLSPRQIFEQPILGNLARLLRGAASSGASPEPIVLPEPAAAAGANVPLTPMQRWLLEDHPESAPSFLTNVLLKVEPGVDAARIEAAVKRVAGRHDAFRLLIEDAKQGMVTGTEDGPEVYWRVRRLGEGESFEKALKALAPMVHRRIDPGRGCHLAAVLMLAPGASRLYLAAHHLVMDAVSWRIFIDDLETTCRFDEAAPAPAAATFAAWAEDLTRYASSSSLRKELAYWGSVCAAASAALPVLDEKVRNVWPHGVRCGFELDPAVTRRLFTEVAAENGVRPLELLLAGLSLSLGRRMEGESITLFLEGHGREPCVSPLDVSRTVGWFTCRYPFQLDLGRQAADSVLQRVVEGLRAVPQNGVGYGVLRRLAGEDIKAEPEVLFNYLGEFSGRGSIFNPAPESTPSPVGPEYESDTRLEFLAVVLDGRLRVEARFHPSILAAQWVEGVMADLEAALREMARLPERVARSETVREARLVQVMTEPANGTGGRQVVFRLDGPADMLRLFDAWRFVASREESRRAVTAASGPVMDESIESIPPHVLLLKDFSGLTGEVQKREVEAFLHNEKTRQPADRREPRLRVGVVRLCAEEHLLVWTFQRAPMAESHVAALCRETVQTLQRLEADRSVAVGEGERSTGMVLH